MATAPSTRTDEAHDLEAARQAEIAAEVDAAETDEVVEPTPLETEADPEQPVVTLRSKNVEQYPVTVTIPNAPPLVFENEDSTVEVTPEVAEQIVYSPVVEVAE